MARFPRRKRRNAHLAPIARLSNRSQSAREKALHVLSDLRRDPNLTLTQAAKNREVSLRSIRKYIGAQLKQERPGGKIRVTASDRLRATLYRPSTKPDVLIPIHAKSSKDRYLVGEWFAAIKEAGRGDFTRLDKFPKGTFVGGVRLPTGHYEVQRILEAMENSESPFEQLYAMAGAA
ncbi:MAG: hypothetical protein DMG49_19045 [Acidobacteria bacterium]|nr:MAG: hypothetical protein DMG49_19045 [Acidobacteriota bacterium]